MLAWLLARIAILTEADTTLILQSVDNHDERRPRNMLRIPALAEVLVIILLGRPVLHHSKD